MLGNNQDSAKKNSMKQQNIHGTKKRSKNKSKKQVKIDIQNDSRFEDFTKPEKTPPVDMYGRPISQDALENYVSSSDDEVDMKIPEDALPSSGENDIYSDKITPIIAVVNQPWKQIRAQDIFQYFFMNMEDHGDDLLSVKVVLSRYGQENPETEAPPPTDSEEIETARWRAREENEQKRYFAICEFKDAESADSLYKNISNVELSEEKGGFFDLQFISSDDFDIIKSFPLRDEAHEPVPDWDRPEIYCKFLTNTKNNDKWDSAPQDRVEAFDRIWEATDDEFTNEQDAISKLLGSGSEGEQGPTREDLEGTIAELHKEEEEDMNESESEENEQFEVTFVEKNEEPEKTDESKEKVKKHKKKSESVSIPQNENVEDAIKDVMEDDRFNEFFAKPGYGIDTTDPSFKRTELNEKFMNELSKKHIEANKNTDKKKKQEEHESDLLKSTVEELKRRASMRLKSNKK